MSLTYAQVGIVTLAQYLHTNPARVLSMLSLCAHVAFTPQVTSKTSIFRTRITDYPTLTPMSAVKSLLINKFITVQGSIVRVSSVQAQITHMAFTCSQCDGITVLELVDGLYAVPTKCTASVGCKGRSFSPIRESLETCSIDCQKLRYFLIVVFCTDLQGARKTRQ